MSEYVSSIKGGNGGISVGMNNSPPDFPSNQNPQRPKTIQAKYDPSKH